MSESAPEEPKSIFVISPIGSAGTPEHRRYKNALDYIVKKAFTAPEWAVFRADEETSPDSITTQVIGRIVESDLIIADLTDHNPNVFYELAVAHGYRKPVIHMMQAGQKVPFDVVDQRVIFYDLTDPASVDLARGGLTASAEWLETNAGQTRNPLSAYGQFSAISAASGGGATGEVVADAIASLSRQVARLEGRLANGKVVSSQREWESHRTPTLMPRHDSEYLGSSLSDLLGSSYYTTTPAADGTVTFAFKNLSRRTTHEVIDRMAEVGALGGWTLQIDLEEDMVEVRAAMI